MERKTFILGLSMYTPGIRLILDERNENMRKKLAVLLLSMSILGLGAGCSGKEETDTENTQNTAQETEEESVVNSEGLVVAVDIDNLEDYVTLGQYQNLTVEEEPKEEVTQEDVDDYVERQLIYYYAPVEVTQDGPYRKMIQ